MLFSQTLDEVAFMIGEKIITKRAVYNATQLSSCIHLEILRLADGIKDLEDPIAVADEIANAFKVYGLIHVEQQYWFSDRMLSTIMDEFERYEFHSNVHVEHWLIYRAFKKAGFKYASECSAISMTKLITPSPYGPYVFSKWTSQRSMKYYDYNLIKNDHAELHDDLFKHLYRPCQIEKWIKAGNELEDYLN